MSTTIYALASGAGKAGISVFRVSGPHSWEIVRLFTSVSLPEPRKLSLRKIFNQSRHIIDEGLVCIFEPERSFTGETAAEFHLHGSLAVGNAFLEALSATELARLAEPGEFTKRAFLNGRINLTEVHGLADLIDAETERQRQQALRLIDGELTRKIASWRSALIKAAALIEVTIDFADEDVPENVLPEVIKRVRFVLSGIEEQIRGFSSAREIKDGFKVAIIGKPNVGKSTLLNAIANREVAITSEISGTTRDVIEVRIDLSGLNVTFLDTAGIRETKDPLEMIGIERSYAAAQQADIRLFVVEGKDEPVLEVNNDDMIVYNKSDITGIGVSALTHAGIDSVLDSLRAKLLKRTQNPSLISRHKDYTSLIDSKKRLERLLLMMQSMEVEIIAVELRGVSQSLASIIGEIGVEDILDDIFLSFCLGK